MGKSYLIEHCTQEYSDRMKAEAFREYNSEILRTLTNGFFAAWGSQSEPFPRSWQQVLHYKPETRTAEEIENHMLSKLKALGE